MSVISLSDHHQHFQTPCLAILHPAHPAHCSPRTFAHASSNSTLCTLLRHSHFRFCATQEVLPVCPEAQFPHHPRAASAHSPVQCLPLLPSPRRLFVSCPGAAVLWMLWSECSGPRRCPGSTCPLCGLIERCQAPSGLGILNDRGLVWCSLWLPGDSRPQKHGLLVNLEPFGKQVCYPEGQLGNCCPWYLPGLCWQPPW